MRANWQEAIAASELWLISNTHHVKNLTDGNDAYVFAKIKACSELIEAELSAFAPPSEELISPLLEIIADSNRDKKLQLYFWHKRLQGILPRIYIGLMNKFGLLQEDDKVSLATLDYLDYCYTENAPWIDLQTEFFAKLYKQMPGPLHKLHQERQFMGHFLPRGIYEEYGLTHALFYMTDFGRNADVNLPNREALVSRLESLCAECYTAGNLDMLVEHLLCLRYLGAEKTEYSHWYADRICEQLNISDTEVGRVGYWYGPFDNNEHYSEKGFPDASHCFFNNYHTTFLIRTFLRDASSPTPSTAPHIQTHTPATVDNITSNHFTILSQLLDAEIIPEQQLCDALQFEQKAIGHLMAWLYGMQKAQATGMAMPTYTQALELLRSALPATPKLEVSRLALLQGLIHGVLAWHGQSDGLQAVLDEIEQHYVKLCRESSNYANYSILRLACNFLCAATAIASALKIALPTQMQLGVVAVLSRALRQRDLHCLVLSLWMHQILRLKIMPVDLQLARAVINVGQFESDLAARNLSKNAEIPAEQVMQTINLEIGQYLLANLQ